MAASASAILFMSNQLIEAEGSSRLERPCLSQDEIEFLASHEICYGDKNRKVVLTTYDDVGNRNNVYYHT